MSAPRPWWADAAVYQIYPRSFQDSDGDGVGDLRGVTSRLEHLEWLGVDALWLSPFYPSADADMGYDVVDFKAVDPRLGSMRDLHDLLEEAHRRGLRVLLDLVPSHTSIEHPSFREHPDWYIWSEAGPANNWLAAFGGSAWTRDERSGRWYLHSFYPEQPDLNWRNPAVREAIGDVVRFWLGHGADGFRVDAVDRLVKDERLRDDPPADEPFPLPLPEEYARLEHIHSVDAADIHVALAALREAAGGATLVGEVYLPSSRLGRYLDHLDLVFSFEFLHAPRVAARIAEVIRAAQPHDRIAWVLSNHDFPRLASRFGESHARAAALLLLTLPGSAFVYQGDEIGMANGPGGEPPVDRAGRDAFRHPMQWDGSPSGGFSAADPWLAPIDPVERNVAAQRETEGSMLELYRSLLRVRRGLRGPAEAITAADGVLSYSRGEHRVTINLADAPRRRDSGGRVVLSTHAGPREAGWLRPGEGVVERAR